MYQDRRGLRFAFNARAEIAPEGTPNAAFPGHVTELSLHGCFVETSASFDLQHAVLVKIFDLDEHIEAHATVLYIRPSGIGLVFRDLEPHFRDVLLKWTLRTLDRLPIPSEQL